LSGAKFAKVREMQSKDSGASRIRTAQNSNPQMKAVRGRTRAIPNGTKLRTASTPKLDERQLLMAHRIGWETGQKFLLGFALSSSGFLLGYRSA
jgi:hypothetical protein